MLNGLEVFNDLEVLDGLKVLNGLKVVEGLKVLDGLEVRDGRGVLRVLRCEVLTDLLSQSIVLAIVLYANFQLSDTPPHCFLSKISMPSKEKEGCGSCAAGLFRLL